MSNFCRPAVLAAHWGLAALDHQGVVVRRALPRAYGVGIALFEKLAANRFGREVVIAFHDNGIVTFGERHTLPDGFGHPDISSRSAAGFRVGSLG